MSVSDEDEYIKVCSLALELNTTEEEAEEILYDVTNVATLWVE